jgi:hypothetical protein
MPKQATQKRTIKLQKTGSSRASSVKHSAFRLVKAKRDTVIAYSEFYNSLKPAEKTALQYYKYAGYQPVNTFLRSGDNEIFEPEIFITGMHDNIPNSKRVEYKAEYAKLSPKTTLQEYSAFVYKYFIKTAMDTIRSMDAVFARPNIPRIHGKGSAPVVLYSGTSFPGSRNIKVGDMITMPDYRSTSFSPRVSVGFMGESGTNSVLFVMRGLQGQPYVFLDWDAVRKGTMTGLKAGAMSDEFEYVLPRGMKFRVVKAGFSSEYAKYISQDMISSQLDAKLGEGEGIEKMDDAFFARSSVRAIGRLYTVELEFVEWKPEPVRLLGPKMNYTTRISTNFANMLKPKPAPKPPVDESGPASQKRL